tara:strand:- start:832 stop:960 length:129 start_codon:yes stop_codon:yes gene_type:complete
MKALFWQMILKWVMILIVVASIYVILNDEAAENIRDFIKNSV